MIDFSDIQSIVARSLSIYISGNSSYFDALGALQIAKPHDRGIMHLIILNSFLLFAFALNAQLLFDLPTPKVNYKLLFLPSK